MNMVVQRARHPELRDYIRSAVNGLLPFIQKVYVFLFSVSGEKNYIILWKVIWYY